MTLLHRLRHWFRFSDPEDWRMNVVAAICALPDPILVNEQQQKVVQRKVVHMNLLVMRSQETRRRRRA